MLSCSYISDRSAFPVVQDNQEMLLGNQLKNVNILIFQSKTATNFMLILHFTTFSEELSDTIRLVNILFLRYCAIWLCVWATAFLTVVAQWTNEPGKDLPTPGYHISH